MDDPNITMEEYIRLEEEKARRHGQTFNWQTATFGKVENYEDEDDCSIDFETEFPAIVLDNTLTAIPSEPTVCPPNENEVDFRISLDDSDDEDYTVIFDENSFLYKIIYFNDLKTNSGNDKPLSPNPTIDYFDDLDYFKYFENEFPAIVYNDGLISKSDLEIKPLVSSGRINEFNLIDEASLSEYDEEIILCFNDIFYIIHLDDSKSEKDNDDNDIDMAPLPAADQRHLWLRYQIEEYNEGIRHNYEKRLETISAPEKVTGVDLFYLRNIDLGTTNVPHLLAQYLFRHAEGKKSGARLLGGHFIGHLAMHFGLVTDEGLRGLWVVAQGPERQQAAVAYAHEANAGGPTAEEEEMRDLRHDVVGLRGDVASFTIVQSRVSTWLITCMTQLMDASGQSYQPFDSTLIGSSRLSFHRRVKPRTGDASSSAAPHTDAQPDP
ncbi:hypothetical protein Tco_1192918 [Tanacetum coccineum]